MLASSASNGGGGGGGGGRSASNLISSMLATPSQSFGGGRSFGGGGLSRDLSSLRVDSGLSMSEWTNGLLATNDPAPQASRPHRVPLTVEHARKMYAAEQHWLAAQEGKTLLFDGDPFWESTPPSEHFSRFAQANARRGGLNAFPAVGFGMLSGFAALTDVVPASIHESAVKSREKIRQQIASSDNAFEAGAGYVALSLGYVGEGFARGGLLTSQVVITAPVSRIPGFSGAARATGARNISEGTNVFRVWGDGAGPNGSYWTTIDPSDVPNFRSAAGLPKANTGRFVSEGVIKDATGVRVTPGGAAPGAGGPGGIPEFIVPKPASQIRLKRVSGANPPF